MLYLSLGEQIFDLHAPKLEVILQSPSRVEIAPGQNFKLGNLRSEQFCGSDRA